MVLIVSSDGRLKQAVRSAVGGALGRLDVEEAAEVQVALDAVAVRRAALVVLAADTLGANPEAGVAAMAIAAPDAAIVVLGDMGMVQEEALLRAGAQDVVLPAACARSGQTALESALRKAVSRQSAVAALRRESLLDPLTGLFNRRGLVQASDALVGLATRSGAPLLALMWDVDGMKIINDAHGHAVGDQALRLVANTVKAALRSSDVVGRIGGDEFCAVAYGARRDDGERIHRRITGALDQSDKNGAPVVSVSGGWAEIDSHALQPLVEAMGRADALLYERKAKDIPAGSRARSARGSDGSDVKDGSERGWRR